MKKCNICGKTVDQHLMFLFFDKTIHVYCLIPNDSKKGLKALKKPKKFRWRSINRLWSRMYSEEQKMFARGYILTERGYIKKKEVKEPLNEKKPEVIKIGAVVPLDFDLPKLSKVKNKTIYIVDFSIDSSEYGKYAVIRTMGQGQFVTTGTVVIKQLERAQKKFASDNIVLGKDKIMEATVKAKKGKEGDYYILE